MTAHAITTTSRLPARRYGIERRCRSGFSRDRVTCWSGFSRDHVTCWSGFSRDRSATPCAPPHDIVAACATRARCPALLDARGPARTRASLRSNMRAFSPRSSCAARQRRRSASRWSWLRRCIVASSYRQLHGATQVRRLCWRGDSRDRTCVGAKAPPTFDVARVGANAPPT
jgi:hypothetical protein